MARKKRTWYNGACYHVMGRGNRRCAIFKSSDDYFVFLICVQMDWEQFDEGRFEAEIEKVVVTNDEITLMRRLIPVTA